MPFDPNLELDMSDVIAATKDSIRRIEGTTDRISSIVSENKPRDLMRRKTDKYLFSLRFITFVLVCLTAASGMYGVLFLNYSASIDDTVTQLASRVKHLETKFREP